MKKNVKRYFALMIAVGILISILIVRLFDMQFQHGEEYYTKSQEGKIKVLRLAGTRGTITDRNGIPLAYDQKSYNVEFVKDPSDGSDTYEEYTNPSGKSSEFWKRTVLRWRPVSRSGKWRMLRWISIGAANQRGGGGQPERPGGKTWGFK